jgi:glycosyltransferase involved in cell wall biosynthesis
VLAAGKPIIAVADTESELARVVVEENVGWVIPADQPEKLADCIRAAYREPDLIRQMGAQARVVAESRYTERRVCEQYVSLFAGLFEAPRRHVEEMDGVLNASGVA